MDDSALLHQQCSICHVQTPKYRCPRCSTKTCSLKCVQRHKQWASCSGKRDPGARVAKSELATPASFDRDYNFLAGVERFLGHAHGRSRELHAAQTSAAARSSKVAEFAQARRLQIVRAPRGLSRQLANQTRWNNAQHCIQWTVEFVHPDGERVLTACNDRETLAQVYVNLLKDGPKVVGDGAAKRKVDSLSDSKRSDAKRPAKVRAQKQQLDGVQDVKTQPEDAQPVRTKAEDVEEVKTQSQDAEEVEKQREDAKQVTPQPEDAQEQEAANTTPPTADEPTPNAPPTTPKTFYLVRPLTSGTARILIPLNPQHPIADTLADQTILEFPTYQVLTGATLPPGLQLNADYEAEQQRLLAEAEAELGPLERAAQHEARQRERSEAALNGVPGDQVLASIQRDFGDV